MSIIVLLIAISLTIAILFLSSFLWSMRSGQFDDTYGPSVRMLFDDKKVKQNSQKESSKAQHDVKA